jgi:hypothetical protein
VYESRGEFVCKILRVFFFLKKKEAKKTFECAARLVLCAFCLGGGVALWESW